MSRKTAHFILVVCDLAALYAGYFVFSEWQSLKKQIALNIPAISFQEHFYAYRLMLIIPVVHLMSLINWQGIFGKLAKRFRYSVFYDNYHNGGGSQF